ncbi:MAG: helix-turn-helix domain containing protein [Pseudomonadota bacterium]|nr:helix-turn-helix domain containing protein [Pseudomonadota bacterium]
MSDPVTRIISRFGTQARLARLMEVYPSAISNWKARGFIPYRQQLFLMEIAWKLGIDLKPEDFSPRSGEGK